MRTATSLVLALLAFGHYAAGQRLEQRAHQGVAKRMAQGNETTLVKRAFSGRWTYYATGLGACGKYNSPGDYIVALNSAQYGGGYPGPQCFKQITLSHGGKTASATIMDECPTCGYGELDLSQGLFEHFGSTSLGVIDGTWWFGGGGGGGGGNDDPATTTKKTTAKYTPPATTKYTPPAEPTTTSKARVVTTTSPKPTSSSKSKASSSHTTSSSSKKTSSSSASKTSSVDYNTGFAAGIAAPAGTAVPSNGTTVSGALFGLNQVIIRVGGLIAAGAKDVAN